MKLYSAIQITVFTLNNKNGNFIKLLVGKLKSLLSLKIDRQGGLVHNEPNELILLGTLEKDPLVSILDLAAK